MKTNIIFHTAALIAALSVLFGCVNSEVELRKSIEIQIYPSTILSEFTAFRSENFEMYEDSHLRITCLLYDKDGNLVYQNQELLDNFNQDISFRTALDKGTYTIVALATCIRGTLTSPINEAYSISGTGSLELLRVKQEYNNSFYSTWSIMGYATQTISQEYSTVSLNLKPATALIYMLWQDVHAHDNDVSTDIYGKYSAQATDYWGKNKYSWTITVEKDGDSSTDVIVKDFSPLLYTNDFTSAKGYNTYKGKINGNTLTIAMGQETGYTDDKSSLRLYGGEENGTMVTFKDVVLRIDNGKLTTTNMFGTCIPGGDGWFELFNSGVVFTKESSGGIDKYLICYHSNDIMQFTNDGTPRYSTSLSSDRSFSRTVAPANTTSISIYDMVNIFPGSSIELYAKTYSGNTTAIYSNQTFTLVSGHQYVFSLDCATFKLTPYEGVPGTRASASGDEFEPIDGNSLSSYRQIDFSQKQFK